MDKPKVDLKHPESEVKQSVALVDNIKGFISEINDSLNAIIVKRSVWEDRQVRWYKERYGIRGKKNFPFPGCSNMHIPIIDMQIKKLLPAYVNLLWGSTSLAEFRVLPNCENHEGLRKQAEYNSHILNHLIKDRMDKSFEKTVMWTDRMLMSGFCIIKVTYDYKSEHKSYSFSVENDLTPQDQNLINLVLSDKTLQAKGSIKDILKKVFSKKGAHIDEQDAFHKKALKKCQEDILKGKKKTILKVEEVTDHFPKWTVVKPQDFIIDGEYNDIQEAPLVCHRMYYSPQALRKMAQDGIFGTEGLSTAEESLKVIREAKKYVPSDKALKEAEERTIKYLNQITLEKGVLALLDWLKNNNEKNKIKNLLKALPIEVSDMPAVIREKNKLEARRINKRLVIYCHETHEDWGVDKEASGIGGSEEAVINISRNLAKLGWNVEVYCSCSAPGFYDGVMWKQFYQHDPKMSCDVFIAWRHSEYILFAPKDSYKILWLHDRQTITNYTPQVIETIDKIFVLSKYHRKDLPEISDDKFYITRNGINTEEFEFSREDIIVAENNNAYLNNIIYASSPDRGLDILLDNWHKIKDINPKAKLHVFYGFTPTYDEVYATNPEKIAFKEKILNQLKTLPDVFYHGRVGHKELAKWFLKCGFWFYPTYFTEISCITAMKAQAAGCIPVATDTAALSETICTYISALVTGNILEKETQEKWLNLYKNYITKNNFSQRSKMRNWAINNFGYKQLALDWSEKFKFFRKNKAVKHKKQKAVLV